MKTTFASDNNAPVHPVIMEAIVKADCGSVTAYGDDCWTEEARGYFYDILGDDIDVYFVMTGTAANVLGLSQVLSPFNSVICPDTAHINVDECGAPEKIGGFKVIPVKNENGKLTVKEVRRHLHGFGFEHHSQPGALSISQVTETGTVYGTEEIRELADLAHANGMYLHLDGARIANACVSTGTGLKEMLRDTGVDVVSFGGTKNGMMFGEAVIFFDRMLAETFKYRRKQGMQLLSKMRYLSVQFSAYLKDGLYLETAAEANGKAAELYGKAKDIRGVGIGNPPEANAVFAVIPPQWNDVLHEKFDFYVWNEETNEVRWMTSYATTSEEIDAFVSELNRLSAVL